MIISKLEKFKKKIIQYKNESDYEKTIQLCCDMIQYGERNNHHRTLVEGYFHRGVSYYNVGDVKNAFKDLMHHKELIENEGTNQDFLNSYNFLFALHLYNEDYVKCKDVLVQLINLTKRIDNKFMLSNGYCNYSHVLNLEGSHEEALSYAEKAYDLAMRYTPDDEALVIRALFNITKSLIYLEAIEESKAYLDQIESMKILKDNQRILVFYYNLKANWFHMNDNEKKALEYYEESIAILKTYKDHVLMKETYEAMIEIYKKNREYRNLAIVQEDYIELMNEIKAEDLEQLALSLEIQRQVIERHKKYKLIQEKNKILELKNKRILEQSKALESVYEQLWEKYNATENESKRDYLTGVFNRQGIEEKLEEITFSHEKEDQSFSCLIFDIDHFKIVNDTYGHLAGDQVIKKTCELCLELMDDSHILGRYGGDEFVVIMEETSMDEAEEMARRIINAVENNKIYLENQEKEIQITLSIGIMNTKYHEASNVKDMIYIADLGLYNAKRKGRNQYDIYEENYVPERA